MLKNEAISLEGKIEKIHIPKFKEFIKQEEIQRKLMFYCKLKNPTVKIKNGKSKLLMKILPKYLYQFKSKKEKYSLHILLNDFFEYLKNQSENMTLVLSSKQLSNLIKFPHILYSLKCKYSNFIFKIKDVNSEIEIEENIHPNNSKLFYDLFENICKSKNCFKVNDNLKCPCLLLYNYLLHLKNLRERSTEMLYDKGIYKARKNCIKEVVDIQKENKIMEFISTIGSSCSVNKDLFQKTIEYQNIFSYNTKIGKYFKELENKQSINIELIPEIEEIMNDIHLK